MSKRIPKIGDPERAEFDRGYRCGFAEANMPENRAKHDAALISATLGCAAEATSELALELRNCIDKFEDGWGFNVAMAQTLIADKIKSVTEAAVAAYQARRGDGK